MHAGILINYGMRDSIKSLVANDGNVFKTLTFGPIGKYGN
jgi:hypothetical protein